MFEGFTKRQVLVIAMLFLIAGALTAWGSIYIARTYILARDYDEPLARQGLKPEQAIQAK